MAIITCLENWPVMILFKVHRRWSVGEGDSSKYRTSPHCSVCRLAKFRGDELSAAAVAPETAIQRPFQFQKEKGRNEVRLSSCPISGPPATNELALFLLIQIMDLAGKVEILPLPLSLSSRPVPWSQTPNPNFPLMDPPPLQNKWSKAVCLSHYLCLCPPSRTR